MVIFNSYVKLPEGNCKAMACKKPLGCAILRTSSKTGCRAAEPIPRCISCGTPCSWQFPHFRWTWCCFYILIYTYLSLYIYIYMLHNYEYRYLSIYMRVYIYIHTYIYILYPGIVTDSSSRPCLLTWGSVGQMHRMLTTCQAVGRPKSMSRVHMWWRRSSVQGVPFMMM